MRWSGDPVTYVKYHDRFVMLLRAYLRDEAPLDYREIARACAWLGGFSCGITQHGQLLLDVSAKLAGAEGGG